MNEIWLSQQEVSATENMPKRTFWRHFKAGWYKKYQYVDAPKKNGGRGGKTLQVALSELSPAGQERYLREVYEIDKQPADELAAQFQIRVPSEKLTDPKTATKIRMLSECLAVPKGAPARQKRVAAIAQSYGYSKGTAYRLMKNVEKGKPIFKTREEKKSACFNDLGITLRAWDQEAGKLAIEAIMANRRNKVEKLALYNKVRGQVQAQGLRMGTYESFCWIARKLKENHGAILTYRDKGIQGLRQDVMPPVRRDPTAYRPMECLVGDQHKADYYAFDSKGNVATLELFCWMDFRTQLVWSAFSLKHYNRYTVGQALLNAVRWGLPATVYTDWGKPEESNYINMLVEQLTGLGIRIEQVNRVRATPRHPQAKPIEGWFSRLDQLLKNDDMPGYMKRLEDPRENELQQKELRRQIKNKELFSVPELVEWVTGIIDQWNNHDFKNRGAEEDNGKSPLLIYKEGVDRHPVTTLSEDMLDYFFLPVRIVKKVSNSQVTFKTDYFGKRFYHSRDLSDVNGREAQVRYDPFDWSAIWVFVDNKLICQANEWGTINPKMSDVVADRMRQQKALNKQVMELYKKYCPPGGTIRRINPHERQARELKTVRVLRTQLEREEEQKAAVSGQQSVVGGRQPDPFQQMYSIDRKPRLGPVNDTPKSFMRLNIDDPITDED